jgi:hypothetical protein
MAMRTGRATRMSTEHGLHRSRFGLAIAVAICGGVALWRAVTLESTGLAREAARSTVATGSGSTQARSSVPMAFADADAHATDRVPDNSLAADDLDVQRESEAATAAIAAELEGDASPP